MKKLKIYISAACIALLLTGCEETLLEDKTQPRDQLTTEVALSSLDGLANSVVGIYERARFPYQDNNFCLYKAFYTDIVRPGTHLADQAVWNEMMTFQGFDATNDGIENIFNGYYAGLSRANIIIRDIDNLEDYNPGNPDDVAIRNQALGEAYFFRAYFHLNLVRYWENIVLADRVITDPEAEYELVSGDAVYSLIETDLLEAIGLLPNASDISHRGRATKGVARHMLSTAYLDMERWTDAIEMADAVIDDPAYDFAPLDVIFSNAPDEQDNSEVILSWQFSEADQSVQRTSQQMVPLYDRANGVARTFEQGGRPWSRMVPSEYYFTLFEDDDQRLAAWHKLYWTYDIDDEEDPLPEGVSIGDTVTAENIDETEGVGIRAVDPTSTKYWEDDQLGRAIGDAEGFRNIIQYRLSHAYLVAAEAHLHAGTPDQGQSYLDAIRNRAGVDPIPLTEENFLEEHARELGHEGHRYPMLKRFGILLDRIQQYSPEVGDNMLEHHVRWPIPQAVIDLTGLPQNEDWN